MADPGLAVAACVAVHAPPRGASHSVCTRCAGPAEQEHESNTVTRCVAIDHVASRCGSIDHVATWETM